MKFKQATENNVAENRAKLSPKLQEELKEKEAAEEKEDIPVEIPVDKEAAGKKRLEKAKNSIEAEAIISVNLRLQPHMNAEILCVLYPGIKVRVYDSEDPEWYSLTYQGRDVFVKKEYLKTI